VGSVFCRDVFGVVELVSGLVRRGRVNVGTCSAKLALCQDVIGEVCLEWRRVRGGRLGVGTCSRWSG